MICGENIPTTITGICSCGKDFHTRYTTREFIITRWNLGPYQEYRCNYCGNQAFLDTREEKAPLMVLVVPRPLYNHKEQAEWYHKHCQGVWDGI